MSAQTGVADTNRRKYMETICPPKEAG